MLIVRQLTTYLNSMLIILNNTLKAPIRKQISYCKQINYYLKHINYTAIQIRFKYIQRSAAFCPFQNTGHDGENLAVLCRGRI